MTQIAEPEGAERIHQLVFRWQGNNDGRQGTGLAPVAHSCGRDRADELRRELGSLLWVEGGRARRSLVRATLATEEVALIQRWPTHDQNGRPSTASHVLVGSREALNMRRSLALVGWDWSTPSFAETAVGQLPPVYRDGLLADEQRRMRAMMAAVPQVEPQLVTVAAEWLRDARPRISLLASGLPKWPEQNLSPLLLLGLFGVFGGWCGQPWTFATYDVTDTHPLRLMCLPEWQPASGQPSPLVRVDPGAPTPDLAHQVAAELVRRYLADPERPAGRPELRAAGPGGTGREERLRALDASLRRLPPATATPPPVHGRPASSPPPDPPWHPGGATGHGQATGQPVRATRPEPPAEPHREPLTGVYSAPPGEPHREPPAEPHREPPREPHREPLGEARPVQAPREDDPPTSPRPVSPAATPEPHRLHGALLALHPGTPSGPLRQLVGQLALSPDATLLKVLRDPQLPYVSQRLVLDELGRDYRIRDRDEDMASQLCGEVLDNNLYFAPSAPGHRTESESEQARWSARLFSWAVAPRARDPRHQQALTEVLHLMTRQRHPAAAPLLYDSILRAPADVVPDLPAVLWQSLIRDLIDRQHSDPGPPAQPPPPPSPESGDSRTARPGVDWGRAVTISVPVVLVLAGVVLLLILVTLL